MLGEMQKLWSEWVSLFSAMAFTVLVSLFIRIIQRYNLCVLACIFISQNIYFISKNCHPSHFVGLQGSVKTATEP